MFCFSLLCVIGARVILNRRVSAELSAAFSSVWTPPFCKRHGVVWRKNQWNREVRTSGRGEVAGSSL